MLVGENSVTFSAMFNENERKCKCGHFVIISKRDSFCKMNNQVGMFIFLLLEKHYNRNYMKIERKSLRDAMDPFEIPDNHF